jgi:hypothetical protein
LPCKLALLSERTFIIKSILLSEQSEWKGPRAVAITSQLPGNLRFPVIPKGNSGSETRGGKTRIITPFFSDLPHFPRFPRLNTIWDQLKVVFNLILLDSI